MSGRLLATALAAALAIFSPAVAAKYDKPVDLELVLGVDVSRSIDLGEAQLQREGYAKAFRDPEVIRAITTGMFGRIAVAYFEWAGLVHREVIADWTLIENKEGALAFAAVLGREFPSSARRTSISGAIDFATPWFDNNGFEGMRRVIDLSGDGPNNGGDLVTVARRRALARGVTINGLPILDEQGGMFSYYNIPNLDLYYRDCVIGGPGAFIEVATDFKDFARAVRRKLILEIAGLAPYPPRPRLIRAQARVRARASPPCDIGEQLMRQRYDD